MLNTSRWLAVWVAVVLLATLTPGGAGASGAGGSSIYIGPDWCAAGGSVNIRWQYRRRRAALHSERRGNRRRDER